MMRYYKSPTGEVYGFEQPLQDELITGAVTLDWEDVTLSWPPALMADKAAIWERIKSERDRRILAGGYRVGDHWFHSDMLSRTQQIGLVMMGGSIPAGLQWKTMDGTFVAMTPQLASQIFAAAAVSDQAIFTTAEGHRLALESCPDVESYDFSGGWPPIFGE